MSRPDAGNKAMYNSNSTNIRPSIEIDLLQLYNQFEKRAFKYGTSKKISIELISYREYASLPSESESKIKCLPTQPNHHHHHHHNHYLHAQV